jgi:Ni/Fe-hydrogenase 1 B-type cytochrome subunit
MSWAKMKNGHFGAVIRRVFMLRLRHSLEIRIFHWLFFITISLKLWSGFYISWPSPLWGFSSMYSARMLHANLTSVLASLLAFRLYFAVASKDWRHIIIWRRSQLTQLKPWLRYFFFMQNAPPMEGKYHIGPRILFTMIFLSMPLFYASGAVMLNLPIFRWVILFFGSQGMARAVHFLASVLLASLSAVHIYLALFAGLGRLRAMVLGEADVAGKSTRKEADHETDTGGSSGEPYHGR